MAPGLRCINMKVKAMMMMTKLRSRFGTNLVDDAGYTNDCIENAANICTSRTYPLLYYKVREPERYSCRDDIAP